MLLSQGAQLQTLLSEFGLHMGSDLITEFSQIEDFQALHDWGKEKILPELLEEGEDEESQVNRRWGKLSQLATMSACASYALHHRIISGIARKLRAVLGQTFSHGKERGLKELRRLQPQTRLGSDSAPPSQASDGEGSGGIS